FGHLGPVRHRLPIAGNAGPVGVNHHRIAEDHRAHPLVPTEADGLPSFVAPELGERQPARHSHAVLVLRGNSKAAQDGEPYGHSPNRQRYFVIHRLTSIHHAWRRYVYARAFHIESHTTRTINTRIRRTFWNPLTEQDVAFNSRNQARISVSIDLSEVQF